MGNPERIKAIEGAGLGLRRSMAGDFARDTPEGIDFLEVAPENWIGLGGRFRRQLKAISERTPLITHGLSLSIGGPAPLDEALVTSIRDFLAEHRVAIYSEHLSYTNDGGQLYDLLPLPFTEEAVRYTADRVKRVQDLLGRRMALENVSYYLTPKKALEEVEFFNAVIREADCDILLDVNNVYVNATNHNYDPLTFISAIPPERVAYLHIAGHYDEEDGLIVDTHGADVIDPVWQLLHKTYEIIGVKPTLLERDFNIPPMAELIKEVHRVRQIQQQYGGAGGSNFAA